MAFLRDYIDIVREGLSEHVVSDYLKAVEALNYTPLTKKIWATIRDEGLDEEFGLPKPNQWVYAVLPISDHDREGLMSFSDEALEKFNLFDIKLKDQFEMKFIDLIDYDSGLVVIVKAAGGI